VKGAENQGLRGAAQIIRTLLKAAGLSHITSLSGHSRLHAKKPGPGGGFIQQSLWRTTRCSAYDSPRSSFTVGFDRFFLAAGQATADGSPGYPPYNIERTGENDYRIKRRLLRFSQWG